MLKTINGYWNKRFVLLISSMCIVTCLILALLFNERLVKWTYIVAGVFEVIAFFYTSNFLYHKWIRISPGRFEKRLIIFAFVVRFAAAILLYYFYLWETGSPFEYNAVDSKFYHATAVRVAEQLRNSNFVFESYLADMSYSDRGYNIFLGMIYSVFGPSVLISRLINAIFSAITVLLIYKLAKKLFDEHAARIAGIAALLLPNFMLYLGTHLKENLMVFMIVAALYQGVRFIQIQRRDVFTIVSLLGLFAALFMFRTVLASAMVGAFVLYAFFSRPPSSKLLTIFSVAVLVAIFGYFILNSPVGSEMEQFFQKRSTGQSENLQFRSERDGGNKFALLAGAPIFMAVIMVAPFPSVVYVQEQELIWMFIGANFIRNFYSFFAIAGIIITLRRNFKKTSLLFFFLIGYLFVLANSGFAISERFHLPAVPILLIYAACGISSGGTKLRKWYSVYVFVIMLLVIGWNFVKVAGRI